MRELGAIDIRLFLLSGQDKIVLIMGTTDRVKSSGAGLVFYSIDGQFGILLKLLQEKLRYNVFHFKLDLIFIFFCILNFQVTGSNQWKDH